MEMQKDEMETIIRFSRADEMAQVFTCDSTVMTKCDKLYKRVEEQRSHGELVSRTYEMSKKLISFRTDPDFTPEPDPEKKTIPPEQLAKMLARRKEVGAG